MLAKRTLSKIVDEMEFISSKDYNFKSKKWFFISGPMRGKENWNKKAFDECEKKLYNMNGHNLNIFNPARKEIEQEKDHSFYMKWSFKNLFRNFYFVDTIVLLPGWKESEGAVVEALVAWEAGIDLVTWDE